LQTLGRFGVNLPQTKRLAKFRGFYQAFDLRGNRPQGRAAWLNLPRFRAATAF